MASVPRFSKFDPVFYILGNMRCGVAGSPICPRALGVVEKEGSGREVLSFPILWEPFRALGLEFWV